MGIRNYNELVISNVTDTIGRTIAARLDDMLSVKDFGAIGDGVTDDYDAFNTAVTSLRIDIGRVPLYIPPGHYILGQPLGIPVGYPVALWAQPGTVKLEWPNDTGLNGSAKAIYPIYPDGFPSITLTQPLRAVFYGLSLVGPGGTGLPTTGTKSADLSGLELERWWNVVQCWAQGFYAGFSIYGNHEFILQSLARNNYYGIHFRSLAEDDPMATGAQFGHQRFLDVQIMRNAWANIAVGSRTGMQNVEITGQLGYSPYNFWREADADGGGGVWMDNCSVHNCNHESIGNAHFACADGIAAVDMIRRSVFFNCETSLGTPGPDANAPSKAYQDVYSIADQNKVVALTVADATGGTFTLNFHGTATGAINYDDDATAVQTVLEAHAAIAPGDVVVAGGPLNTTAVTIEFAATYEASNELLAVQTNSLTGGSASLTIVTTQPAVSQKYVWDVGSVQGCNFGPGTDICAFPGIDGVMRARYFANNEWNEAETMVDGLTDPGGDVGTYGTNRPIFTLNVGYSTSPQLSFDSNKIWAYGQELHPALLFEAAVAGDLLAHRTSAPETEVRLATTEARLAGVAIQAGSAGDYILCASKGVVDVNASATTTITTGDAITQDTTAAGTVRKGTANQGTGTIASGATSTTVTHGLGVTPSLNNINLLATGPTTNDPGFFWITNITATTFDVHCRSDPGAGGASFAWNAAVPSYTRPRFGVALSGNSGAAQAISCRL